MNTVRFYGEDSVDAIGIIAGGRFAVMLTATDRGDRSVGIEAYTVASIEVPYIDLPDYDNDWPSMRADLVARMRALVDVVLGEGAFADIEVYVGVFGGACG